MKTIIWYLAKAKGKPTTTAVSPPVKSPRNPLNKRSLERITVDRTIIAFAHLQTQD
ncbi:MAG: hypothetical protein V7L20_25300 [Nostoc sp.]|uniref:hypothetical protein n=1 Tax=Nostoc sp. TaxID=1180 RepID=UPI002FF731C4